MAALDRVMHDQPLCSGLWQQRLQLQAGAVACRHLGRTETEQSLRDLWQLRTDGRAVGPAGMVFKAYQALVVQTVGRNNATDLVAPWVADALPADELGWTGARPLLSSELPKRPACAARRPLPGEQEWRDAAALAAAVAAVHAVDIANEVARRAANLETVAGRVRTKQAGAVVKVR
nr:DUF1403 family protein [Mesorhizobium shangrilense]